MKILFLCGSAEPGNDGVGDYSRRFCGALIRNGHKAEILSLYDKQVSEPITQIQVIEDTSVIVRRIPKSLNYKQRLILTKNFLNEIKPDWISLQYVPYSFHPKGLPYWLPRLLKTLKGKNQWHFMFHEAWVGIEQEASFKKKCIGYLQKRIVSNIKKSIVPKVIHTQSKIYQYYLSKIAIEAQYLPLFGNVPVTASKNKFSESIVFVVFAAIHDNAPFEDFILDLKKEMQSLNKVLKFIFIGRHGELLSSWTTVLDKYVIEYELLGASSEEKISQVLINGDYGISSTPYKISDKSGVLAAMREHQLPIITVAKPWIDQDNIDLVFHDIKYYKKGSLQLNHFFEKAENSLSDVATTFLIAIKNKV